MSLSVKHKFTSPVGDSQDTTVVQPSNWNDEHVLNSAANVVIGRGDSGPGAVSELPCYATGRAVLAATSQADAQAAMGAVSKGGDTMTGTLNLPANGLNVGNGQLLATGGNVTMTGALTAFDVTITSDKRLKRDVQMIADALAKVRCLTGVKYNHIDTETSHIGFLAQDVQRVVPEVVHEDEDGFLSLAYGNLTALLVEAVKELAAKVDRLEAK